ncbi:AIM24 family protein [Halotia branconii]|uniref:AIM24 family protein n=1 Tax=Halotia branconii TaxID=1620816 RepID=UPI0031B897F1
MPKMYVNCSFKLKYNFLQHLRDTQWQILKFIERESLHLVKITLQNETVRTESGAMYYIHGNITMQSKTPSANSFRRFVQIAPKNL